MLKPLARIPSRRRDDRHLAHRAGEPLSWAGNSVAERLLARSWTMADRASKCRFSLLTLIRHRPSGVPQEIPRVPNDCCQPGRRFATKLRSLRWRHRLTSAKGTV